MRLISEEPSIIDESIFSGESVPVHKQGVAMASAPASPFEAINLGFSGSTVVSGKVVGVVIATGLKGSLGAIAQLTASTQRESGFSLEIAKFSHFMVGIIIGTVVLVFLAHMIMSHGKTDFINLAIFAVALGVTIIPEALPVVTTFGFTRGAMALAKQNVIVKRLSAIEDLGSIQCCVPIKRVHSQKMSWL